MFVCFFYEIISLEQILPVACIYRHSIDKGTYIHIQIRFAWYIYLLLKYYKYITLYLHISIKK